MRIEIIFLNSIENFSNDDQKGGVFSFWTSIHNLKLG
jgi:hypothetical protein